MYSKYIKRGFDICFGIIGIIPLFFVFLIVAPVIYFTDKGPVFYNAERLGKNGVPFKMYKFRSMKVNAPDIRNADGSTYNGDDDPRVTSIGRFMRKTSIDELPQFINVLFGQMSLIGPRPDPLDDIYVYTKEQKKKLYVRPGITGYNQAYYRNSVSQDDKFNNDLYYSQNVSFLLDIKILFKTLITVLRHENIYNTASSVSNKSNIEE